MSNIDNDIIQIVITKHKLAGSPNQEYKIVTFTSQQVQSAIYTLSPTEAEEIILNELDNLIAQ